MPLTAEEKQNSYGENINAKDEDTYKAKESKSQKKIKD